MGSDALVFSLGLDLDFLNELLRGLGWDSIESAVEDSILFVDMDRAVLGRLVENVGTSSVDKFLRILDDAIELVRDREAKRVGTANSSGSLPLPRLIES